MLEFQRCEYSNQTLDFKISSLHFRTDRCAGRPTGNPKRPHGLSQRTKFGGLLQRLRQRRLQRRLHGQRFRLHPRQRHHERRCVPLRRCRS
jgi:hypothetical protein